MNLYVWILPILAGLILLVSALLKKMEYFLNFATRLCVGAIALYLTSEIMTKLSYSGQIGLNTTTLTTVSLLGVPGYFLVLFVELFSKIA